MINFGYVALAIILFVGIFKLWLILVWTTRLHSRHATRYSFAEIFRMMFRPQSKSNFDARFWDDFEPIQNWNILSNLISMATGFIIFIGLIGINQMLR